VAVAARFGRLESAYSMTSADLNGDGRDDIIVAPGTGVSVYLNHGDGTFDFRSLGVSAGNSVAVADYDGDGLPDLFVSRGQGDESQTPDPAVDAVLLRQQPDGTFRDVTAAAGVSYPRCQSAVWIDANDDGLLDLFVLRGSDGEHHNASDLLLINQGDGTFRDQASTARVTGSTRGTSEGQDSAAWGDFDRDGRVDLVTATSYGRPAVRIYRNRGTANHWITLSLRDPSRANRFGLGAHVWIKTGSRTQCREVEAVTADKSQSPSYLMVGTGGDASVDSLRIRWPDGTTQSFAGVASDHRYMAVKGGALQRE
jgi:hypothetical protein